MGKKKGIYNVYAKPFKALELSAGTAVLASEGKERMLKSDT